jgi:sigma-B regulation protein RsbU (phosphoserine phosphatase)
VLGYSYLSARTMLEQETEARAKQLAQATTNRIQTVEVAVEKVVEGLALRAEDSITDPERANQLLREAVENNEELYGAALAFAPRTSSDGVVYRAPYAYRSADGVTTKELAQEDYRYDVWDWFVLPKELARPVWSEPYFDEGGGNIQMATYSVPLYAYDDPGSFWGVVTGDLSLEWLTDLLLSLPVGEAGYAFLISQNGTFISHPTRDLIMNESIFSVAEARKDTTLRRLGQRMIRGESGFVRIAGLEGMDRGAQAWLAFEPIPSTGWSLGVVFSEEEILGQVFALSSIQIMLGFLGMCALLGVVLVISRGITRPLRQLATATGTLAKGDLDTPLPVIRGRDEVAGLSASFEQMRQDLRDYVEELRVTTIRRERIESELRVATAIQMSLVPKTFPPFPERDDMDLFGLLHPAREVAGDFYDFFLVDQDRLCLAIGDVSGKGVPAALFMAVTRSMLRIFFREHPDPGATLERLNSELSEDNDESMFVTLFCAVVDLTTGQVRFANGGHNLPLILRAEGEVEFVPRTLGALLGALAGLSFVEGVLTLAPGDKLFMYTDGVTEAQDPAGGFYGEERLQAELVRLRDTSCTGVVNGVSEALYEFAAGAEQYDDITMLEFCYRPTVKQG